MKIKDFTSQQIDLLGTDGVYLKCETTGTNTDWTIVRLNCIERFFRWTGLYYGNTQLKVVIEKVFETEIPELMRAKMFAIFDRSYPGDLNPFNAPIPVVPVEISVEKLDVVAEPLLPTLGLNRYTISFVEGTIGSIEASLKMIPSPHYYFDRKIYLQEVGEEFNGLEPIEGQRAFTSNHEPLWNGEIVGKRWKIENANDLFGSFMADFGSGSRFFAMPKVHFDERDPEQAEDDLGQLLQKCFQIESNSMAIPLKDLIEKNYPISKALQVLFDACLENPSKTPCELKLVFNPGSDIEKLAFIEEVESSRAEYGDLSQTDSKKQENIDAPRLFLREESWADTDSEETETDDDHELRMKEFDGVDLEAGFQSEIEQ